MSTKLPMIALVAAMAAYLPQQSRDTQTGRYEHQIADYSSPGNSRRFVRSEERHTLVTDAQGNRPSERIALPGPPPGRKHGDRIRVTGKRVGQTLVPDEVPALLGAAPEQGAASVTVQVIPVLFAEDANRADPAGDRTAIQNTLAGDASFYTAASYGKTTLQITVTPVVRVAQSKNNNCSFADYTTWAQAAAAAAGATGTYMKTGVVALGGLPCGWSGLGDIGGARFWINGGPDAFVMAHEMGHTLGRRHASSEECSTQNGCSWNEYGDDEVMGGTLAHFSLISKTSFGWDLPAQTTAVTTSGVYTLAGLQLTSAAVKGITVNGVTLSVRVPAAGDKGAPAVVGHKQAYGGGGLRFDFDPVSTGMRGNLLQGEAAMVGNAVVTVQKLDTTGATVKVEFGGTPPPPPADAIPPTLDIFELVDNATFMIGAVAPWSIYATDNVGVAGWTFQGQPSAASGTVPTSTAGTFTLTWEVFDAAGNRTSKTYHYTVTGTAPPPPTTVPVNCVGAWDAWMEVSRTATVITEQRAFVVTTAPVNGGTACPVSPETRTMAIPTPPPPPTSGTATAVSTVKTCTFAVTVTAPPSAQTGWAAQVRRDGATFGTKITSYPRTVTKEVAAGTVNTITVIWTRTGSATITQDLGTVTCAVTSPPPPPPPPPPSTTVPPIPELARWEAQMVSFGKQHCDAGAIAWAVGAQGVRSEDNVWYYDGAKVYQQIAAYTKDPSWDVCATASNTAYRAWVLSTSGSSLEGWRIFPHGLANDFRRTSNPSSKDAVMRLATQSAWAGIGGHENCGYSRETAFVLNAYVAAEQLGATRSAMLTTAADNALKHLSKSFVTHECAEVLPFMMALAMESLIGYDALTHDPRVQPAIEVAADAMWAQLWDAPSESFLYANTMPSPAPDLNLLIAPAYAWLWQRTGAERHLTRGDAIFAGGVRHAWLGAGKAFSQNYRSSFDFVAWRSQAPGTIAR